MLNPNAQRIQLPAPRVPESPLKDQLIDYKRKLSWMGLEPIVVEAEERAVDRLLERMPLIDWYSMSNFWMLYVPLSQKDRTKKMPWRRVMPRAAKSVEQYTKAAVRTLLHNGSDCFLTFVPELEFHCRYNIFRSEIMRRPDAILSTVGATCATIPIFPYLMNWVERSQNPHSFYKLVDAFLSPLLAGSVGKLREAKGNAFLAIRVYNASRRAKKMMEAQKNTEGDSVVMVQSRAAAAAAHADPNNMDLTLEKVDWEAFRLEVTELCAQLDTIVQKFRVKVPLPYLDAIRVLPKALQHSEGMMNETEWPSHTEDDHDNEPERENDNQEEVADVLGNKLMEPTSVAEDEADVNLVGEGAQQDAASDKRSEQGNSSEMVATKDGIESAEHKKKKEHRQHRPMPTLEELCGNTINGFNNLISELTQKLEVPELRSIFELCDRYGLTDSREKLRLVYQLDGAAKCEVGGSFEEKVVDHYLPAICDIIAESYCLVKGIDSVEEARAWLTWCLCPPTATSSAAAEAPNPPISILTKKPVPQVLYSTGTVMRCFFEFQAPAHWLEKPFTYGEYDLLLVEDTPSLDVLFAIEVKNNCADIEKAGRQRDKLFTMLDNVWGYPALAAQLEREKKAGDALPTSVVNLTTGAPPARPAGLKGAAARVANRPPHQPKPRSYPPAPSRPFLLHLETNLLHSDNIEAVVRNDSVKETTAAGVPENGLKGQKTLNAEESAECPPQEAAPPRGKGIFRELNESHFKAHFSDPRRRQAHFIMITALPEKEYQPGVSPLFFASTGKLSTLLIRQYAEEVAHGVTKDLYQSILNLFPPGRVALKLKCSPFIRFVAQSAFTLTGSACTHPYLTLPLSFPANADVLEKNASGSVYLPPSPQDKADPLLYALYLKRHNAISSDGLPAFRQLHLLYPVPPYPIRLNSCPGDKTFTDVLHELLKTNTLRTLYFL